MLFFLPVSKGNNFEVMCFGQCRSPSKMGLLVTLETKTAEFANSVDPDQVAHNEPPHLDLHCLP